MYFTNIINIKQINDNLSLSLSLSLSWKANDVIYSEVPPVLLCRSILIRKESRDNSKEHAKRIISIKKDFKKDMYS